MVRGASFRVQISTPQHRWSLSPNLHILQVAYEGTKLDLLTQRELGRYMSPDIGSW